ncbi:MAG: L,D-transpeptidase family protein [Chthoniobacterales bacterium]|nr:L,D-transpeptidase family protein [Chthoniobacterales bacterium]
MKSNTSFQPIFLRLARWPGQAARRRAVRGVSLAVLAAPFLISCASKPPGFQNHPDFSTAYLGPNGEILFASPRGQKKPAEAPQPPEVSWSWVDDNPGGSPSIVIDLSDQTARFFKGGVLVGISPVSTGREGYSTPSGDYSVIEKDVDHVSTLYGDYVDAGGDVVMKNVGVNKDKRPPGTRFRGAAMPYFLRITGAVGMHAGYLPGYAASHGCIRLPRGAAEKFYENAPYGTPVRVTH